MVNLSLWQTYVEQICGFVLPLVQCNWLTHAVAVTAENHGMSDVDLYHALIQEKDERVRDGECINRLPPLTQSLLNNLLIAESRFFRHEPSMMFIGDVYKTEIEHHRRLKARGEISELPNFSVWSVGCSTGQEVYSLAMTLTLIFRQHANPLPFNIYGSDLSERSLGIARTAEYSERQIAEIPTHYRPQVKPMANEGAFDHQRMWHIDDKTYKHTEFFWHNIFTKEPVNLAKQQVIICQNVLIYFRKFDQRDILAYFVQNLAVGGYLVLAPNEAMFWHHPKMKRIEDGQINAWYKISD
ncbi:CheR family methyltransferase [Moraxella equi]|uniref:Chemotaxis protein methyltransferase n=1 Tax=Moraxella equi TaxID=60442 RepID=A0A378QTJ4_9GAMM|nr:CheR family methyltransferase [Moraxella equi]MDO5050213.1 CheR family methyltransferase [Moraxella equi]OPH39980.1 hypothetical protein B5J93_01615 [Moraxella equi]STZ04236.1 Chemotaxis protein methyltransferase [Moraxella equi]